MMRKKLILTVWLFGVVILAACTPSATAEPTRAAQSAADLANTKWALVSFDGSSPVPVQTQGRAVTLEFRADGALGGSGGCNSFSGMYKVEGGSLKIGEVASTLMACAEDAVTQQEQRYFQALAVAGRFEVSGNNLKIWYGEDGSSLNFTRAE